jgi:RNA recognition motif-containing protein
MGSGVRKPSRRQKKEPDKGRVELYVGNLPYEVRSKELRKMFEEHGRVLGARIIQNKFNGKSKGFGFVEMADGGSARAACRKLNGSDIKGRKIVVNEAKSSAKD